MEDFTSAIWNNGVAQADPNTRLTIISNKVTWIGFTRNEIAYFCSDRGLDHFAGDFEFLFTLNITDRGSGDNGLVNFLTLANDLGTFIPLMNASKSMFSIASYATTNPLVLMEIDGGVYYQDAGQPLTPGTTYYLKLKRVEADGTYGTLYLYLYSDSARTDLLDTLSIALHSSKKDFRYLYAVQGFNDGNSNYQNGYIENLDLQEAPPPPSRRRSFPLIFY